MEIWNTNSVPMISFNLGADEFDSIYKSHVTTSIFTALALPWLKQAVLSVK